MIDRPLDAAGPLRLLPGLALCVAVTLVAEALQGVEGAYCLLVVIGDTLVAARDPRGWRPFAMGRLGDATVFASETCALDLVGATFVREVAPGEVLVVLEAMKMEQPVTAPQAGVVTGLTPVPGATVAAGDLICRISPA